MLEIFDRIRIQGEQVREWFLKILRQKAKAVQSTAAEQCEEMRLALRKARQQADKLQPFD